MAPWTIAEVALFGLPSEPVAQRAWVTCIGTQSRYQAFQPAGGHPKKGAITMANFEQDDFGNEMRPERDNPSEVKNKAPVWIAGVVIVVAIIGVVAYESGNPLTHRTTVQTQDVAPQPVAPKPPAPPEPPPAKP
jgi:hypothetical protein